MKINSKTFFLMLIIINISVLAEDDYDNSPEQMIFRNKNQKNEKKAFQDNQNDVDINAKNKIVEKMVNDAVNFFMQNSIEKSCREFGHNLNWRNGEIFPFIFDIYGNVLVHGDDTRLVWKNLIKVKKDFKNDFNDILNAAEKGGWVRYRWNNSSKSAYVKTVDKKGLKYIIGAGFFPESKEYDVVSIVKEIVRRCQIDGVKDIFSRINNPIGMFVKGDLYAFVYDYEGNVIAYGQNPALVGQNLINLKDTNGTFTNKKMIEIAQSRKGKGWITLYWRNIPKRVYVERVTDPTKDKSYVVACGYYPTVNNNSVYSFVSRAIRHLKDVGAKQAFSDFSNPTGEYIQGGMTIFAYNLDGICVANGENPEIVNQNMLSLKDPEGKEVVKTMLKIANKNGKGTFTYEHKNAIKSTYIEKVDVPDGVFVIGSGFYPDSKSETVRALVNTGTYFLNNNHVTQAFDLFSESESEFFRGDIFLFVYSLDGTSLVNGTQSNMIWQNYAKTKDEQGKTLIDNIISLARAGGGWITYNSRNAKRRVYTHLLEKQDADDNKESFVIGSGYYL